MLTKTQSVTYVPGVPAVSPRAAYEVCTGGPPVTAPPNGHWERVCGYEAVAGGIKYGPNPGEIPVDPGPFPRTIYVQVYVCKSVWVPN